LSAVFQVVSGLKIRRLGVQSNLEEIISYMEDKFRPYEVFDRQMKRITHELIDLGYTLDEITRGINAYLLQLEPLSTDMRYREKGLRRERSFRILDGSESRFIGRDAYGYLYLLREIGLVNAEETEEIINYIVENKIEVDTGEQLQSILVNMVLDSEFDERLSGDNEEEQNEFRNQFWHNFRKKRLH